MKWRAFALTAALLGRTYVPLVCFAGDDKTNSQPSPQNGPAAIAPVEPEGTKVAYDGSINDIDAIGHRNVGCATGAGNWYSLEKQIAWGKQISQEVESQSKVINDPVISEYVNRAGENIVRNSDSQVPFTIKVIDSDDVNAFAFQPVADRSAQGYALFADGPVILGLEPNRCRRLANPPICRIGLRNIALRTLITLLPE